VATTVDIFSPDLYVEESPHESFAELRKTEPVCWQSREEGAGAPGFWAVLKHADVVAVARQPTLFSAQERGVTLEPLAPEELEAIRHTVIAMDPPQHGQYRQPLGHTFKPRALAQLEGRIRERAQAILAEAAAVCEETGHAEFVSQVCARLPSEVFGELMGVPHDDRDHLHRLTMQMTRDQDPDIAAANGPDNGDGIRGSAVEMAMYAIQLAASRRQQPPQGDLMSVILDTEFGGNRMNDMEIGIFFVQLVVAGNDTTVTLLSSGLQTLLQYPNQLAQLRDDPSLIPTAVEEILRFANPVHYISRTATADTELHGVPIQAGDRVAMYYTSANRDEDVFPDSQRFDVRRSPNPHLAFGIGEHFCLGAYLSRLEGRAFFEELLAGYPTIELAGEPKRLRSNLINALKHLPVNIAR
jgi:cytochrome P450